MRLMHLKADLRALFILTTLVTACDRGENGSGVASETKLVELSDAEIRALCAYVADLEGPPRTIDCGGGRTLDLSSDPGGIEGCVSGFRRLAAGQPSCTATVGDVEGCFEVLTSISDEQVCAGKFPRPGSDAACAYLLDPACLPPMMR